MMTDHLRNYIKINYGVEPKIVFKVHDIMESLPEVDAEVLFNCVYRTLRSDPITPNGKYYKNAKILLILDEIQTRLDKLNDTTEKINQLTNLSNGDISINELNNVKKEEPLVMSIQCISCGEDIKLNDNTKKYSCNNCFIELSI